MIRLSVTLLRKIFQQSSKIAVVDLKETFDSILRSVKKKKKRAQLLRSKTKTNHNSLAHIFPRFASTLRVLVTSFAWFTGFSTSFRVISANQKLARALTNSPKVMALGGGMLPSTGTYLQTCSTPGFSGLYSDLVSTCSGTNGKPLFSVW